MVGGEAGRCGRASANFGPEVWLQPLIRSTTTPPSLFSRVKLQSVPKVLQRLSSGELLHCASPLTIIPEFEHKFKILSEVYLDRAESDNPFIHQFHAKNVDNVVQNWLLWWIRCGQMVENPVIALQERHKGTTQLPDRGGGWL